MNNYPTNPIPRDEDGFPLDTPKDHPARRMMEALDILTGDAEKKAWAKAMARTDYTDEFLPFIADFPELAKGVTVRRVKDVERYDLEFEVDVLYEGWWYQMRHMLSRLEVKDSLEGFWRARQHMWREMAHRLLAKLGLLAVRQDLAFARDIYERITSDYASFTHDDTPLTRSARSYVEEARYLKREVADRYARGYNDFRLDAQATERLIRAIEMMLPKDYLEGRTDNDLTRLARVYTAAIDLIMEQS